MSRKFTTLAKNVPATGGSVRYIINDVSAYKHWNVEIISDTITYPAGQNDAVFTVEDSETPKATASSVWFEVRTESLTEGNNIMFRIVDLNTDNLAVKFTVASANGGTYTITVTSYG